MLRFTMLARRLAVVFAVLLADPGAVFAIKATPSHEALDHPAAVLVNGLHSGTNKACSASGVLIAPTVVLTAAHCVHGFDTFEVIAPYGKKRLTQRAVTKVAHVHPRFHPGDIEDDLAVLMLKEPLQIGRDAPPLHDGNLLPLETKLVVVGRVKNGNVSPAQLFEAPVTLVSFPSNTNLYGGFPQTVEKGDSGGPVFLAGKNATLVGIVSGILEFSRGNVSTDTYVPISQKNREWLHQYIPREQSR